MLRSLRPLVTKNRHVRALSQFSTIDAEEVKKFSAKSAEWWDPHGEFGMLHLMNPTRVSYIRDRISTDSKETTPFKGLRMLDIGCGGGLLSESLVRLGGTVVGADASYNNIQMATLHSRKDPALWTGSGKLEYRNTTAEDMLAEGETFDVVLAMEIIEHVNNPSEFLRVCTDMVRPGGKLLLSTISRTPMAYFLTNFMAEDVLKMVHKGTHDWSKYIKSEELIEAIQSLQGGWNVDDVRGIAWNPLKGRWVLSDKNGDIGVAGLSSLEVNYVLTASKASQ
ncbi:S-adenosyl-L-methionine-dependent methyltransferase [Umbelopsis sp. PMI_123]|nr:S-adenosyl-L-methionine-dependent methyltransferase [Umbelopsis sp. PMI_123]